MSKKIKYIYIYVVTFLIGSIINVEARNFNVSIALMPGYCEEENGQLKGTLIDLINAIDDVMGTRTEIKAAPFIRSIRNVLDKVVDFHIPLLYTDEVDTSRVPYSLTNAEIFKVVFALYTQKDKEININRLAGLIIETDAAHTKLFPFQVEAAESVVEGLRKLEKGRIDGFVFSQGAVDPALKELNAKNIKKQFYKTFSVRAVVPKGEENGEVDKFLAEAMDRLKKTGKFESIDKKLTLPYTKLE